MKLILALAISFLSLTFAYADHEESKKPDPKSSGHGVAGPECVDYRRRFFPNLGKKIDLGSLPLPPADGPGDGAKIGENTTREATLWGGTGDLNFPTSTKNAEAQKFFLQGLGQLYGYDRVEANRSFLKALKLDPKFAMAYWGILAADYGSPAVVKQYQKNLPMEMTEREKLYLDSQLARQDSGPQTQTKYVAALKKIVDKFPDDIDARAWLGHERMGAMWMQVDTTPEQRLATARKIDKLFTAVLAKAPYHPVHHFRIHLWDGIDSTQALDSAEKLGASANGIAHMWHMPGHTYYDLGRYGEAAGYQMASVRSDNARLKKSGELPHEHGDYSHNVGWLVENLIHIGRFDDAIAIAKNMVEWPREDHSFGPDPTPHQRGAEELSLALRYAENWDEAITLGTGPYLEASTLGGEIDRLTLIGHAYAQKGMKKELAETIARMKCLDKLVGESNAEAKKGLAPVEAPSKLPDIVEKGEALPPADAEKPSFGFPENITLLEAWMDHLEGKDPAAKAKAEKLRKVLAARDDEPDERSLGGLRNNLNAIEVARLTLHLGDAKEAVKVMAPVAKRTPGETVALATLTEAQLAAGEQAGAEATYRKLAEALAYADPARLQPPFERLSKQPRLAKIATLGQKKPIWKTDKDHPPLDDIGPLTYRPPAAPKISGQDVNGKEVTIAPSDFEGKQTLVFFNLGGGCVMCNKQLQNLVSQREKFRDYRVVVVTNEKPKDLATTRDALLKGMGAKPGDTLPFQLVGDPSQESFKAYNAFNAHLDEPLHGVTYVDKKGEIRWRDIHDHATTEFDKFMAEVNRMRRLR